ncbi:hypothetical protein NAEGRDRAFT_54708 [Naegleria gruberi]|uniref:NADAR domain-containing protein n=1 Tax=Naegleria gruberi TaxID=5762 RepID=D2W4Z4_NAEGR|nr:uncharacterized protein NAEGRDRAFT_54708 [Naegleria gruberi]EFC35859.1 hypothetical protein NAEGRDRAFT_54708 [Naegleria gruberi]|eukprot:XP_002668603.1 hypothetical protein NAEGRDRAFT_54708 [Naegleria gruberi strain NEG-M]
MKIDGKTFVTCEQYMMYQKAQLFNDHEMAEKILKTSDPKQCKEFGRKVKNFDTNQWEANRDRIVYEGNYAKFTQNEEMRRDLLSRLDVEYVEASPYDKIWGIGLEEKDQRAHDRSQWKGLNLLGRIITQIRDDLINESAKK